MLRRCCPHTPTLRRSCPLMRPGECSFRVPHLPRTTQTHPPAARRSTIRPCPALPLPAHSVRPACWRSAPKDSLSPEGPEQRGGGGRRSRRPVDPEETFYPFFVPKRAKRASFCSVLIAPLLFFLLLPPVWKRGLKRRSLLREGRKLTLRVLLSGGRGAEVPSFGGVAPAGRDLRFKRVILQGRLWN